MKQMNAFGIFCCFLFLLFILEAHQRVNLVITNAKVKHLQLQIPAIQIVFKRMARLINIYSQTPHSKTFITWVECMKMLWKCGFFVYNVNALVQVGSQCSLEPHG